MKDIKDIRRANFRKIAAKHKTQITLAAALGVSPGYVSQLLKDPWKKGSSNIGEDVARKFEKVLNLGRLALDADTDTDSDHWEQIVESGIFLRKACIMSWTQEENDIEAFVSEGEDVSCPSQHGRRTYALRVKGDAMQTTTAGQLSFTPGMLIFIDPDKEVADGSKVIAKRKDNPHLIFREYREDAGRRLLKPLNQQYPMQEIGDDIMLCGVAVSLSMDI
jgi:SOS-response transcriptional repressor LexA